MFNFLENYGVKVSSELSNQEFDEVDIIDKLKLGDQINSCRKRHNDLISLMEEINVSLLDVSAQITLLTKEIVEESKATGVRANDIFNTNDKYIELTVKKEALRVGLSMVNESLDFVKTDLRILNSTMYNKF